MTERQYILQHLLHLVSYLSTTENKKERDNLQKALRFYSHELAVLDKKAASRRSMP